MTVVQLLRDKRQEILRLAAQHDAWNVHVFGSLAQGMPRMSEG